MSAEPSNEMQPTALVRTPEQLLQYARHWRLMAASSGAFQCRDLYLMLAREYERLAAHTRSGRPHRRRARPQRPDPASSSPASAPHTGDETVG